MDISTLRIQELLAEEVEKSKLTMTISPPAVDFLCGKEILHLQEMQDSEKATYISLAVIEAMTQLECGQIEDPEKVQTQITALVTSTVMRTALAIKRDVTWVSENLTESVRKKILETQDQLNGLPQLMYTMDFYRYFLAKATKEKTK